LTKYSHPGGLQNGWLYVLIVINLGMKASIRLSIFLLATFSVFSCSKEKANPDPVPAPTYNLTYGDSVFYLNNQTTDYTINPVSPRQGTYIGFPEGIEIDSKTGEIDVSKSETGLRYRISFIPDGTSDTFRTTLVISGINFLDGFYRLNTADSVIKPVYNANVNSSVPGVNGGSVFDDGSSCNSAGCNVNTTSGSINLAQTVRNGVFGSTPTNNDRHEFEMNYRINDKSGKSLNSIKIKLYYFESINDVTQEAYDIISSREGAIFGLKPKAVPFENITSIFSTPQNVLLGKVVAKPRPPCIFILGR
jgi:hypothetical protein